MKVIFYPIVKNMFNRFVSNKEKRHITSCEHDTIYYDLNNIYGFTKKNQFLEEERYYLLTGK